MTALTGRSSSIVFGSTTLLTEQGAPVFRDGSTTNGLTAEGNIVFGLDPLGAVISMAHFWLGGAAGVAVTPPPVAFGGPRSMAHFWMGGAQGGSGGPPPPTGGFIEPPYFIVNTGRMMNRRGM